MSFSSTDSFDIESLTEDCHHKLSSQTDDSGKLNSGKIEKLDEVFEEADINSKNLLHHKSSLQQARVTNSSMPEEQNQFNHNLSAEANVDDSKQSVNSASTNTDKKENKDNVLHTLHKAHSESSSIMQSHTKPKLTKKNSEEDVKSLLSYWSDKASLHSSLKRAASAPGGSLKIHWLEAMQKAKNQEDPWKIHDILDTCLAERAKRFRYNALKKKWVEDIVFVKMQEESFGQGAMRKCFRMKKLSTSVHQNEWEYAGNVVAKRYIEEVMPKVYFDDVKLQMDAKLWAEEYNRHNPPKKIDIIQVACIEMIDREDSPMYHVEHFVEGEYVKYNSNSGFVLRDEDHNRATPQAFSHFTFERSGHQMIVVDIQGVGDLYTDPQIHTAKADEYGDANLGSKGMALFFATHECSSICEELNLEKFDLSEAELLRIDETSSRSSTSTEVKNHAPHSPGKMLPMFELVERLVSISSDEGSSSFDDSYPSSVFSRAPNRHHMYSELDSGISSEGDASHENFFNKHERKSACVCEGMVNLTADCIDGRLNDLLNYEEAQISILGQIHFDLAVYNHVGRFTNNQPDYDSILFHLNKASLCGSLEANKIMAAKYFNLPTDQFDDLKIQEDHDRGMDCLVEAATRGDKEAIIKTAKAFDTGVNLGKARKISWPEAIKWYEAALNIQSAMDAFPAHEINARMAEMWREGNHELEKDPSYAGELYTNAAESAMTFGKGKLANKYFMLAEEAWGEVEEE